MGEVKRLYAIGGAGGLESVKVIRETPKRYYTEHHRSMYGRKFVKKDDMSWFPSLAMAIQCGREILKKRILYREEEIYRQKQKSRGALVNLDAFDALHGVVDADSKSEESYWMQKQREGMAQDEFVDTLVTGAAGAMAAGCVSGKWQCVIEDLAPLIKDGKLEQVVAILQEYWPPDAEIEALTAYGLVDEKAGS